ncbi:MAG TPA: TIGR02266 family protein [Anaeromyxobacteraceae bacterium]|nr:TIGR02266 family protein [Anaeromyxobacteraceae bacterium]
MAEHREHARVPVELKVVYARMNRFFADYTRNLSRGGAFVLSREPLPIGTRIALKLTLPSLGEPIALEGEVVRHGPEAEPGMGIRFAWVDERARAEFEALVGRLMRESLGPGVASALLGEPEAGRKP